MTKHLKLDLFGTGLPGRLRGPAGLARDQAWTGRHEPARRSTSTTPTTVISRKMRETFQAESPGEAQAMVFADCTRERKEVPPATGRNRLP